MTAEEYRRVTEVTYLGTVHGTLSALRRMRARNRGTIVQVGSALAYRGIPLQSAYCAAKHAVQGFTESLRCELLHDDCRVRLTMVVTIAGNKIAPSLGDWYLAKTGFDAQQTNEAVEPGRRDNLWEPVPGDHGAHGTFTDRALTTSPMLWASMHRSALRGIAGGVAAAVLARRTWAAHGTWR